MGKRTHRLQAGKIPEASNLLVGKEAHIVLWDGKTRFGTILEVTSDRLKLRDKNALWYNQKKHTHTVSVSEIRELIYDEVSRW